MLMHSIKYTEFPPVFSKIGQFFFGLKQVSPKLLKFWS